MNTLNLLIGYESGNLNQTGILTLFQHLVDTGLASPRQLLAAAALLESHLITAPTITNKEVTP